MDRFILFAANHPILIGIFVILLILLIITESRKGGRSIESNELTHLVNKENAVIVDLRDSSSFKAGHISQSLNIPHTKLKERVTELNKYKTSPIILVCAHGQHSGASGQILTKAGFNQVLRLKGGVQSWTADKLPLVKH